MRCRGQCVLWTICYNGKQGEDRFPPRLSFQTKFFSPYISKSLKFSTSNRASCKHAAKAVITYKISELDIKGGRTRVIFPWWKTVASRTHTTAHQHTPYTTAVCSCNNEMHLESVTLCVQTSYRDTFAEWIFSQKNLPRYLLDQRRFTHIFEIPTRNIQTNDRCSVWVVVGLLKLTTQQTTEKGLIYLYCCVRNPVRLKF